MRNSFKRILSLILSLIMTLSIPFYAKAAERIDGIGDILSTVENNNIPNVQSKIIESDNSYKGGKYGLQTIYTSEFKLGTGLIPYVITPDKMYGGQSTFDMVTKEFDKGVNIVAAVNGDFFEMPNSTARHGVSHGLMINNGNLLATNGGRNHVLGFTSEGEYKIIDKPQIIGYVKCNGKTLIERTLRLNKDIDGQQDADMPKNVLYTNAYGTSTNTLKETTEIVVKPASLDVKLNRTIFAKVVEIRKNSKNTPIPEDCFVLCTRSSDLDSLKENDLIEMKFEEKEGKLRNITTAIAYVDDMLKKGIENTALGGPLGLTARTCIGFKKDGTVMIAVADGKQSGYRIGMDIADMREFYKAMDYFDAINLDGGGSTTLVAKTEKDKAPVVINKPAERPEIAGSSYRKIANVIAFVDPNYIYANVENGGVTTGEVSFEYNYPKEKFKAIKAYRNGIAIEIPENNRFSQYGNYELRFTKNDDSVYKFNFKIKKDIENDNNAIIISDNNSATYDVTGDVQNIYFDSYDSESVKVYADKNMKSEIKCVNVSNIEKYVVNTDCVNTKIYIKYSGIDELKEINLKKKYKAPDFKDEILQNPEYYAVEYINFVKDLGIVNGNPDGLLYPEGKATRYEAITMIMRFLGIDTKQFADKENPFVDVDENVYAINSVKAAYSLDIAKGNEEEGKIYFKGDDNISRVEFCALFVRAITNDLEKKNDNETEEEFNKRLYDQLKLIFSGDADNIPVWSYSEVLYAVNKKIMNGVDESNFAPNEMILRDQIMIMIARTIGFVKNREN